MNAPAHLSRPGYAGKVAIRHAIEAVRACGMKPVGCDLLPDGTIRVYEAAGMPKANLFDRLEQAGKI